MSNFEVLDDNLPAFQNAQFLRHINSGRTFVVSQLEDESETGVLPLLGSATPYEPLSMLMAALNCDDDEFLSPKDYEGIVDHQEAAQRYVDEFDL